MPTPTSEQIEKVAQVLRDCGLTFQSGQDRFEQAARAVIVAAEGVKPRVRHKKRGTTYGVIGTGKMQAEDWEDLTNAFDDGGFIGGDSVDMREVVIYRSEEDGSLWVRPVEEFNDGRFSAPEGE